MRSIWSGSISFGLINIPVKLYSAAEDHAISFDLLHKTDLSPIRYARICKADGKEIPYNEIVKGYEYEKGEYVVIEEQDFKQLEKVKTGAINIFHFSKKEEIDSIYFERPYYLEPGKGADKSYALLRETLLSSNKVAVVKYVFKNKEHLGIIKPYFNALVLNQMRFASEIRSLEELKLPEKGEVTKKEIDMALKLVDQLTDKFQPESYQDEYTHELQEVIDAKIKGITPSKKVAPRKQPSKVHDIMSLLKASIEEETKQSKKQNVRSKAKKKA